MALVHRFCLVFIALVGFLPGLRAAPTVVSEGAFAPSHVNSDALHAVEQGVAAWDSLQGSDSNTGNLRLGPFVASHSIEFAIAGNPANPGMALYLVRDDGARLDLRLRYAPGEHWSRVRWWLPKAWLHHSVTLVAEDHGTGPGDWIGVSAPLRPSSQAAEALQLAALQLLVFAALLLPGFAFSLFITTDPLRRLCWTMMLSGLVAYLEFFAVFLRPAMGPWLTVAIALASLVVIGVRRTVATESIRTRDVFIPLVLALLACLFYSQGAFLYGGMEAAQSVPLSRVLWGLPSDPQLPHMLADMVVHGRSVHPFCGDWLSSDRPPLQAALEVMLHPVLPSELGPALVGIAAQAWVWIGFWIFLRALPLNAWQRSLVLVSSVFSGFFFLNSLFYWPKLLPTGFLLAAAGLLWGPAKRLSTLDAVMAAACLAMSLLGHGGSFFAITGMAAVFLVQRGLPGWKPFLAGASVVMVVMAPWILYQKLADPPGDRLIKFHLAGHTAVDPRPSLTVIREAYAQTPLSTILTNKLVNVQTLFFRQAGWWDNTKQSVALLRSGHDRDAFALFARTCRIAGFFHYGQTLACLLPGALGGLWLMLRRRGTPLETSIRLAAALTLASCLVWCLLMFSAGTTVIHQGTYFTGACLFTAAALGLDAFPRWLERAILGANLLWFFAIWMIAPIPMPYEADHVADTAPFGGFAMLVAFFAVCLLGFLHWLSLPSSEPEPASPRAQD